jgi:AraC family transcriptional activator of pobA
MKNLVLPVYSINKFEILNDDSEFYANFLNLHVKNHHFTKLPHKHDFFLTILFTQGHGKHEVDFQTYEVVRGSIFVLKPGQMHFWELSDDVDGYIFFHSRMFYESGFNALNIKDFPFFNSLQSPPVYQLAEIRLNKIQYYMNELVEVYQNNEILKFIKIQSLITLVYCEISREKVTFENISNKTYLAKLKLFEDLIEVHFKEIKFVKQYALKLNITEKHLNRITKNCLGKTSTQLIGERNILEAKRMLIYANLNISQIGEALGYFDTSYFVRFFKKNVGCTPSVFLKQYKSFS